jgi:hypothetical protein
MTERKGAMIELTEQQRQAVARGEKPPTFIDPDTQAAYVLVRKEVYERMREALYDDSPWTDEEMDALAWEAGQHAGWDDMDEYDDYPKKP